jgi:hypothetical protein
MTPVTRLHPRPAPSLRGDIIIARLGYTTERVTVRGVIDRGLVVETADAHTWVIPDDAVIWRVSSAVDHRVPA